MSRFRGAWTSLNFYKEYLFGFETLVFATSQIFFMHQELVTLQREEKFEFHHMTPLKAELFKISSTNLTGKHNKEYNIHAVHQFYVVSKTVLLSLYLPV